MDRRIKKIFVIISLILIALGLFLIWRTYSILTEFKRTPAEETLPVSSPVSYIPNKEMIKEDRLMIGAIDVNLEIGTDEKFLDYGGWIVKLNQDGLPLAIAIHRFGLSDLTNDERIHQTLLHVDILREGDLITLHWKGKEYFYQVESLTTNTNNPPIKDDELLLYTCEYWFSPKRVFVLAKKMY